VSAKDTTTSTCTCPVAPPPLGQEIFYPPGTTPPVCSPSMRRSGAPRHAGAKQLDYALTAAMNCVMLQPSSNPGR